MVAASHVSLFFLVPPNACRVWLAFDKGPWRHGPRLNIKTIFPGYTDSHKDETVVRPSYLYDGNSLYQLDGIFLLRGARFCVLYLQDIPLFILLMVILLTHLPMDKMAIILQTIFSNAFSRIKKLALLFKFHSSFFQRFQLRRSCFGKWFSHKSLSEPMLTHFTDAYMWHQGKIS